MLRIWIEVLTKPSEQLFAAERDSTAATLSRALTLVVFGNMIAVLMGVSQERLIDVQVTPLHEMDWGSPSGFILTVVQAIGAMRVTAVGLQFDMAGLYARVWMLSDAFVAFGFEFFNPLVQFVMGQEWLFAIRKVFVRPLYFLSSVGAYYLIARALGGQGEFGRYAYLFALWSVPLYVVVALIGFLPLIGPNLTEAPFGQYWYYLVDFPIVYILSWLLSLYSIGLAYLATRVEHGLVWWRVVIVVIVGYVVAYIIRNNLLYSYMGLMRVPQLMGGG